MRSLSLGRAVAAAVGLMSLLAPTAAVASWWDGGYDGRSDGGYEAERGDRATTTTSQAQPGYGQPDGDKNRQPDYSPPPENRAPAPCEQPAPCGPPPPCEQASPCGGPPPPPPAPPPPPPPGAFGPIYGCENSDLPDSDLLLHKTTTPPPGAPVRPGDEIFVEITWRPFDWAGPDLHKVIDCVYINGLLAPGLSGGERLTPNDGHFAWHYFVPLDVPPGSTICDQGFASGPDGWDEYGRRGVSNVVCFPVDLPPPPPPPPPCCAPPPPVETTTTTTTTLDEPRPYTDVDRVQYEAPEEIPPAVLPEQQAVLPRTGGDAGPGRLAAGALALALMAGRLRRGRHR